MGRYSSNGSYGHRIMKLGDDSYRLFWTVDRYYSGSRLRFPRTASRDTDKNGALKFSKKWDLGFKE